LNFILDGEDKVEVLFTPSNRPKNGKIDHIEAAEPGTILPKLSATNTGTTTVSVLRSS